MRFHTSNIQKPVVTLTSRTHHQATLSPQSRSHAPRSTPPQPARVRVFPRHGPPAARRRPRLSVTGAAPRPRPRPTPTRTHYQRSAGMIPKTNK